MNKINNIYTTVSDGRVHIAADTKYIGTVDSYNNCFTQFFAWVFRYSMTVNFDGKVRSVNKESYTNLISSLNNNARISDIGQRSLFRTVAENATTLPKGNPKMRDVITGEDRQELFKKLAVAISRGDTTKALSMIGKGAELDTAYYDRGSLSASFNRDTSDLDSNSRYNFNVFYAAPILQAARKGNKAVVELLQEAGANLSVTGSKYIFKREITNVSSRLELDTQLHLIPHHYHDSSGRQPDRVRYETEYTPQLRERTVVSTKDSRTRLISYKLREVSGGFNIIES